MMRPEPAASETVAGGDPPCPRPIGLDLYPLGGGKIQAADDRTVVEQIVHEQRDIDRAVPHANARRNQILGIDMSKQWIESDIPGLCDQPLL